MGWGEEEGGRIEGSWDVAWHGSCAKQLRFDISYRFATRKTDFLYSWVYSRLFELMIPKSAFNDKIHIHILFLNNP